jgi:hypothetical protein
MKLVVSCRITNCGEDHTCYTDNDNDLEETGNPSSDMFGGELRDVGWADH